MKVITPQTLSGFRDFLPSEKKKRDFILKKIIEVFEQFGFEPIETPTLEYASLLLGKYGTEADKLVYKFNDKGGREIALRYDQTVPTARVLAQNQNPEILPKILRRYQIQNVFRTEKPQKGRYREFTQCDIDIFGSENAISDAEILACTYFTYKNIGFKDIIIALNDRSTLFTTLSPFSTQNVSSLSIIQSIDKLGKISEEEVIMELIHKGLEKDHASSAMQAIKSAKPSKLINKIVDYAIKLGVKDVDLAFTPTLARGLDYYTGMIFEVKTPNNSSSLCGGGRYDNLVNQLCNINIAAVGMAIGFDRTVEVAEQLNLIPQTVMQPSAKVLVIVFKETVKENLILARKLRDAHINTEVFADEAAKLDKQLKYADKKGIPFVVILGPKEITKKVVRLKDLQARSEEPIANDKLIESLNKKLKSSRT